MFLKRFNIMLALTFFSQDIDLTGFFNEDVSNKIQVFSIVFECFGVTLTLIEIYFSKTADLIELTLDNIEKNTWSNLKRVLDGMKKALDLEERAILGGWVSLSAGSIATIVLITLCLIFLIPSITFNQFGALEKWALAVYVILPSIIWLLLRKIHWSLPLIIFAVICLFMSNSGIIRNIDVSFNFGPILETLKLASIIIFIGMFVIFLLIVGPILILELTILTPVAFVLYLLNRPFRFFNALTNGKAVGGVGVCLASIGLIGEFYQFFTLLS